MLEFYRRLPDSLRETFLEYGDALPAKDLVSLDTAGLREELYAIRKSVAWCGEDIADSILTRYVTSGRMLFERGGVWRAAIQDDYRAFRKETSTRTAESVFDWVREHVKKVEERGYFSPMKSPTDVRATMRGTDGERYLFTGAVLRSLGIPARVKWSYDAIEYWDGTWKELRFEAKERACPEGWIDIEFNTDGEEVSSRYRYYYDYSITRFDEYPKRLDPPVDTAGGKIVVTLDRKPSSLVTGWRNGYGDTYVRIKRFEPAVDTLHLSIDTGIPDDIGPGDLIAHEYTGLDVESLDIEGSELTTGAVLVVVFDLETEASKSTLLAARKAINSFRGKRFFFVKDDPKEEGKAFLGELGIHCERVTSVSREVYRKKWNIRHLPAVLYLRDGNCVFWTEGLFLHLGRLLGDLT